MVNLLVDLDGKPSDPVVEFASRPDFAAPAAAVVLEWLFSPAVRTGKAFAARSTVQVQFPAKSAEWSPAERKMQAELRYARSYDDGPREKSIIAMVFPYEALLKGEEETLTLNVLVSPEGRAVQIGSGLGTHAECIASARASLASWTFFPATKAGRPVFGLMTMQFTFEPHRDEFEFDEKTFELIAGLRAGTAEVSSLKNVDEMPRLIRSFTPALDPSHTGPAEGEAMVEFIIDATGRTQLPRIVRATSPDIGWAAATAAAQWKFEPARKGGEPVTCRARQLVKFAVNAESPATP